jgi:hypothetical protein
VTGPSELTRQQQDVLADDGYLLVPSVLDEGRLWRMKARLDELARAIVAEWETRSFQDMEEQGVVHAVLDLTDPDFAVCHRHPLLSGAATAVIGSTWEVCGLGLRAPMPGCGHQGLHRDFAERRNGGPWQMLAAMWCVTGFNPDNGPLRVIPGSHRSAREPIETLLFGSGMGPHPEEVKLIAPAGSLILFNNADLWHSGTLNYSPALRLAVTTSLRPAASQSAH